MEISMTNLKANTLSDTLVKKYGKLVNLAVENTNSVEHAIEAIDNYYERIIGCMPGNVYWLDSEARCVGCNENVLNMFGFTSMKQFKGLSFEEMAELGNWEPSAMQSFKDDTMEVINTGKAKLNIEEPPIPHADGRVIYFLTSRVPLFDERNNVVAVVGISIDITDRKMMEIALEKEKKLAQAANQAKAAFLENMQHDIRTPLTGIIGFADILKREVKDPRIKEYADNLVASSYSLLDLLNGILEAIKVSSGDIPLLKKKFSLQETLNQVIKLNQANAHHKNIALSFEHDANIPNYVIGDPTRLHRIILELVTNALNFTAEGFVRLSTMLAKENENDVIIKITVEDSGMGIAPEDQQEIYTQFRRLTPSYQGIYKGAGLGLSITKKFIDDLKGELYVESEKDMGATFTCIIKLTKPLLDDALGSEQISFSNNKTQQPTAQPIKSVKDISRPAPKNNSKNRILVVEDSLVAAKVLNNILSDLNCSVDIAETGKLAVYMAKRNDYDLIFMDIGLPDIDGYETTKHIRLNELYKKHVPIIALTAHIDEENKQRCIQIGMNAVLTKPLGKEKAEDILDSFIAFRQQPSAEPKPASTEQNYFHLSGAVLDFQQVEKQYASKDAALKIIYLMANSLTNEKGKISKAYKQKNWPEIQALAHKLNGGASYCGTKRLQQACAHLEAAISSDNNNLYERLYQQLETEIQQAYKAITAKVNALNMN
jgi:two-component system aerobic respiration control sensor histidine kinase ArcB